MRDRMRVRPDARPSADDAPTGPIPRVAVPTQLPRSKGQTKAAGPPGRHPARVLLIIGLAQLMVVLDTTIVNIALPSAQSALGFGTESRQWIVTAYSLAFGALLLIGGRLSDIIGRRRTLLVGLLGFAAASAVGGAAVGFGMLVAARAAQGIFAAILAPAALSTLNVTFTEGRERSRAFGIYAAIASGGAVVGLLLGGALTEWLSWRWCLYVNLLFALPAAALVFTSLPAKEIVAARARRLDWPGVLAVSGGLFCLVYGLSNAQTDSWTAPLTIGMFIASAALLALFVPIEARAAQPLLPLHIVADRNRVGSYLAIGLAFCSMFGVFLFLTYYLQQNLRYSPLMTGVAFLPFAAGIAVSAGLANTQLVPRFGPRPLVPAGMTTAAAGMFWLQHLTESSTYAGRRAGTADCAGSGRRNDLRPGHRYRHRRGARRRCGCRLGDGQHQPADRRCDRHSRAIDHLHVSAHPLHDEPPAGPAGARRGRHSRLHGGLQCCLRTVSRGGSDHRDAAAQWSTAHPECRRARHRRRRGANEQQC